MLPSAVWICLAAAFMSSDRDSVVVSRSPPGEGDPAQDCQGLLVGVLNHARAPLVGSVDLRAASDRRAGQGGQQGVE